MGSVACRYCVLRSICLPEELSQEEIRKLESIVYYPEPLEAETHVYRMGDTLDTLFVLRSGAVKNYHLNADGDEQVPSFSLPGELLGLDALGSGRHQLSALTLERTTVCRLPFSEFEKLGSEIPALQHQFTRLVGKHIAADQELLLIRGRDAAEERLAMFLLNFSRRLTNRGFSGREFNLSMSRHDLAKYLGMAVETVSRSFTRFRQQGIIEAERRNVRILDPEALQKIARL